MNMPLSFETVNKFEPSVASARIFKFVIPLFTGLQFKPLLLVIKIPAEVLQNKLESILTIPLTIVFVIPLFIALQL